MPSIAIRLRHHLGRKLADLLLRPLGDEYEVVRHDIGVLEAQRDTLARLGA